MGMLSDRDIIRTIHSGRLVVKPLLEPIQPTSIDMRLGNTLIIQKPRVYDPLIPSSKDREDDKPILFDSHCLSPGDFVIGATLEWVEIPDYLVGVMVGKSKLARIGLQIEAAGHFDSGWAGNGTLEIKNLGQHTIILRPGMTICQMRFEETTSPVLRPYGYAALNSHYQGSIGPKPGFLDQIAPETP